MTEIERLNAAVDEFAAAIKTRLDEQAAKGYQGWDGAYPARDLASELAGDALAVRAHWEECRDVPAMPRLLIDIGARAMMLHFRSSNKSSSLGA